MKHDGSKSIDDIKLARIFAIVLLALGIVVWWSQDGSRLVRVAFESRSYYRPLTLFMCLLLLVLQSIQGVLLLMASFIGRKKPVRTLIVVSSLAGFLSAIFWMNARWLGIDLLWGFLLASDACLIAMASGCFEMIRNHAGLAKRASVAPCAIGLLLALYAGWGISTETLVIALGFAALWETCILLIVGCKEDNSQSGTSSERHVLTNVGADNEVAFRQIKELKSLLDDGLLTQEEYDSRKHDLLGIPKQVVCDGAVEEPCSDETGTSRLRSIESISELNADGNCLNNGSSQKGGENGPDSLLLAQGSSRGSDRAVEDAQSEVELLRGYKELFDSGVISQMEFDRKKAEILGFESEGLRAERKNREAEKAARQHKTFKAAITVFGVLFIAGSFVFLSKARSVGLAIVVAGFLTVSLVAYLILDEKRK